MTRFELEGLFMPLLVFDCFAGLRGWPSTDMWSLWALG